MSGFAAQFESDAEEIEEAASLDELTAASKVVFSSTLQSPLSWANTRLVKGNAVEAVGDMKADGISMYTVGSLGLCRSLLKAGLVDRFRVGVFPVITGSTRPRQDLWRLPQRRPRNGCQPHVRRQAPTARDP